MAVAASPLITAGFMTPSQLSRFRLLNGSSFRIDRQAVDDCAFVPKIIDDMPLWDDSGIKLLAVIV